MTKEELIKENAKFEQANKEWSESDLRRRLEFAKAFGFFKKVNFYTNTDEYRTPTWPEIFVEIGKLSTARSFMEFEGKISRLESKLEEVIKKIIDISPTQSS